MVKFYEDNMVFWGLEDVGVRKNWEWILVLLFVRA